MSKGKKIYFFVLILFTILVTTFYFSYAIFSNTKEEHGKLNIVAGTLNYKIESSELDSDSITVPANTSKEIKIKLTSLNEVSSKYELYYILDKTNDKVSVGYSKDTKDNVLGTIEGSSSKVVSIVVRNDSDTTTKVTFKVLGGLVNNELALKDGNSLNKEIVLCSYEKGYVWNFDYTGGEQEFTTPCSGNYKIELWGAQGGGDSTMQGGKGAYTAGNIIFQKETNIYLYIGEKGSTSIDNYYNFNNGAESVYVNANYGTGPGWMASGGGSTDVRLVNGIWNDFTSLKSRIMVAAGGGGGAGYHHKDNGGAGGGLIGYSGTLADFGDGTSAKGATQIAGGSNGGGTNTTGCSIRNTSFGIVQMYNCQVAKGGNGYYAGGSGPHGGGTTGSGGGGSSFISGHSGCDAITESSTQENIVHTGQSIHYSGYKFINTIMVDGEGYNWTSSKENFTGMPSYIGSYTITGNDNNGYARITYLGN